MVALQFINKILETKDFSEVEKNGFDRTYFAPYQSEFDFISEHYKKYGNVPDDETFMEHFKDFDLINVNESFSYLTDRLNEEHLYLETVPIIEKSAEILKGNSHDAVNFLNSRLSNIKTHSGIKTIDIIHDANKRYDDYYKRLTGNSGEFIIPTGFNELDFSIHGWNRGEELVVLFARTNQGKSWVLTKTLGNAWRNGYNVGFISPEMSANRIGYRFDTLNNHFNNSDLLLGNSIDGYKEYLEKLSENPATFNVSTPEDFGGSVTITKIKAFIKSFNIDILGIDGITYLEDERNNKLQSKQEKLTNISEDLFKLSREFGIPVIIVVQANRDGVKINGGNLELENIRDADGIAHNASKVIAIRQKVDEEILELSVKKNRDGKVGDKFIYQWKPNTGDFNYIPSEDDGNNVDREEQITELKDKFKPTKIVF